MSRFLRYFDGPELSEVKVSYSGYCKENKVYWGSMVYLLAKPGKYDLVDIFQNSIATSQSNGLGVTTTGSIPSWSVPINTVVEVKAGNAYYAGEIIINWDKNYKRTYSILFNKNIINDSIVHDFEKECPNFFNVYKNSFVPATFSLPVPLQLSKTKVIFSSHFSKNEGIWKESNDSLHKASYENGQYCIEGKSSYNLGSEIIQLPEKLGSNFDIELRCKWETGLNNYPFGLIIPGHHPFDPKCPQGELEPCGYIFGISSNGFACILYEGLHLVHFVGTRTRVSLTNWKKIQEIKTNDSGQNIIRVQVIDNVITYYINDIFVSREPYNGFPNIIDERAFMNSNSKLLGIYSLNKQKIEFDEIKVSKF